MNENMDDMENMDDIEQALDYLLEEYLAQFTDRNLGINKETIDSNGESSVDVRIIGLDLSLSETGFAIFSKDENKIDGGSIKVSPKIIKQYNLTTTMSKIEYIVEQLNYEFAVNRPALVVIEDTFCNPRNMKTSKQLIQLGGVVRYILEIAGVPYIDIAPSKLKLYVTGKGNASKDEMVSTVNEKFGINVKNNNVCDAIGCCVYGVSTLSIDFPKK